MMMMLLVFWGSSAWEWEVGADAIDYGNLTGAARGSLEREAFDTGAALLQNFLYANARREFLKAAALSENFVMARWGILQSCWQPVWLSEDDDDACEAAKLWLASGRESSSREKQYVDALLAYWETPRDLEAYTNQMAAIEDDLEARVALALALIAYASPGEWGFASRGNDSWRGNETYAAAAARLLKSVLDLKPDHPGALHYTIHLADAPATASSASAAAEAYPLAAPSAWHAQHMPSHLALRQGRWGSCVEANDDAIAASQKFLAAHPGLENPGTFFDHHSAQFQHYCLLQRGEFHRAHNSTLREARYGEVYRVAQMTALEVIESTSSAYYDSRKEADCGELLDLLVPACATCDDPRNLDDLYLWSRQANVSVYFAAGLCFARKNDRRAALVCADEIRILDDGSLFGQSLLVAALALEALVDGDPRPGFAAVSKQRTLGPSPYGWPMVPPADEFLAAILLSRNQPSDALRVLDQARSDTTTHDPGRARFQFLRANATAILRGPAQACALYAALADQLRPGDPDGVLKRATRAWLAAHDCRALYQKVAGSP